MERPSMAILMLHLLHSMIDDILVLTSLKIRYRLLFRMRQQHRIG
jgi:hypothetical protein